jgi:putative DNA primase/helicase
MSSIPPQDPEAWKKFVQDKLAREQEGAKQAAGNGHDGGHRGREEVLRQLRIDIGRLHKESPPKDVTAIIDRIAACEINEIEREALLLTVKAQTKTSIRALRVQLADCRKQGGRGHGNAFQIEDLICEYPGGQPLALESNAIALLRAHPEIVGVFALDEFRQRPMLTRRPPWPCPDESYPRPVRDADLGELLAWIQRQGVHLHGKTPVRTALGAVIRDHTFHPVRDYLDGLVWDRTPRLDSWLTYYLGVEPIENYTGQAGRLWLISAVARIYKPGCLAKYVLILEGKQDLGKSTALAILGGDWFTDDMASLGSKDSQLQTGNAWIIELAELDSTRHADINQIKAFISRRIDSFRPPYGEHLIEQPRQCVLAGTVNPAGPYLHDETGAIRFWPVTATNIDLAALRDARDQLWAEAVSRYKAGERWWPSENFAPLDEQEGRSETAQFDPWFHQVQDWTRRQIEKVFTVHDALQGAVNMPTERMDKAAERRAGKILRYLGYASTSIWIGDKKYRRWRLKPADHA